MKLASDYPYWSIRNGLIASYPSLDRNLRCDCVVIGGGITGALVAYHLAKAGIETVLVDRRDVGTGSTSGSTGLLQYEVDTPLRVLSGMVGAAAANRSYELCGEAIAKLRNLSRDLHINCGFEKKPSLQIAKHRNEIPDLQKECRLRRKLGIEVEFWDQAQIAKHFPFARPGGLFSANGAQIDPHRLAHGLLAAGQKRGLKVYDRVWIKMLADFKQHEPEQRTRLEQEHIQAWTNTFNAFTEKITGAGLVETHELKTSKPVSDAQASIAEQFRSVAPTFKFSHIGSTNDVFFMDADEEISGGGRLFMIVGAQIKDGETRIRFKVIEYKSEAFGLKILGAVLATATSTTYQSNYKPFNPSDMGLSESDKKRISEGLQLVTEKIQRAIGSTAPSKWSGTAVENVSGA